MRYTARKENKEYYNTAEWIIIKLCDKLDVSKVGVRFLASALADEYQRGYDDAILQIKNRKS